MVPSDSPRRSAPATVAVQVFELTEQVSVTPRPVIVTVSPSSAPLVVMTIVPSALSSAAFRYAPQLGTTMAMLASVLSIVMADPDVIDEQALRKEYIEFAETANNEQVEAALQRAEQQLGIPKRMLLYIIYGRKGYQDLVEGN